MGGGLNEKLLWLILFLLKLQGAPGARSARPRFASNSTRVTRHCYAIHSEKDCVTAGKITSQWERITSTAG